MKTFSFFRSLLITASFAVVMLTPSCSTEEIATPGVESLTLKARTDFSGLEDQVRAKAAQRDNIPLNSISNCHYAGPTQEGYGKYTFWTSYPSSGIYIVTGIIGDEIEGL